MGGLKKRKQVKKLQRRIDKYPGEYPTQNPGKDGPEGIGHILHKPGSQKK